MKRASYIGFLFCLTIFAAAFVPFLEVMAQQQEVSFVRGQKLNHMLSVCLDKDVAVSILDADAKEGFPAASAIWEAAPRCASVPVVGGEVGRVVKAAKVKRGDRALTARVVEIVKDGEVIGYFFTTSTVDERNS